MARQLRELPTYSAGGFSSAWAIGSAIAQHERGQFQRSADLVDVMSRDDRCAAVERTRIQGLLGLDLDFAAASRGRRKDAAAKDAEESWPQMFPESAAYHWIRWGLYLGIGIGQNVVDTTSVPGKWIPRLRVWHPRYLTWDWLKRLYVLQTEDGPVEIAPDDPEWCLFTPYGYERGWMGGLVRNLATAWLFRQWTIRDWGRWSEVHGQPIKVAKVPLEAQEEDKERFQREVTNLGSESTIRAIDGGEGRRFDVEFREPLGKAWESFSEQLDFANTAISVCVLGHNLTTEVKGGSYAAARVGDDVRTDIRAADAKLVGQAVRDGILKRWAKWNYGDPDLAPWPVFNVEPAKDLKAAADTLVSLSTALDGLRKAGANPDVEEILEEFSVPSLGPLDDAELLAAAKARAALAPPVAAAPAGQNTSALPPQKAPNGAPPKPNAKDAGEPVTDGGAGVRQAEA